MIESPILDWLIENESLSQWLIAFVLIISGILVILQIRQQTKSGKGANFMKAIEMLNDEKMLQSTESVYSYSKLVSSEQNLDGEPVFRGADDLKQEDQFLPEDTKNHIVKIRETYHSIGVMLMTGLIDIIPFLMLKSSESRDMWNLLSENVTQESINRERNENDVLPWRGFEYVGKISYFWSVISQSEKMYLAMYPRFIPVPDSFFYTLRIKIHEINLVERIKMQSELIDDSYIKNYFLNPFLIWAIIVSIIVFLDSTFISSQIMQFVLQHEVYIPILFSSMTIVIISSTYPLRQGLRDLRLKGGRWNEVSAVSFAILLLLIPFTESVYFLSDPFVILGTAQPQTIIDQESFEYAVTVKNLSSFLFIPILSSFVYATIKSKLTKENLEIHGKFKDNLRFVVEIIAINASMYGLYLLITNYML